MEIVTRGRKRLPETIHAFATGTLTINRSILVLCGSEFPLWNALEGSSGSQVAFVEAVKLERHGVAAAASIAGSAERVLRFTQRLDSRIIGAGAQLERQIRI